MAEEAEAAPADQEPAPAEGAGRGPSWVQRLGSVDLRRVIPAPLADGTLDLLRWEFFVAGAISVACLFVWLVTGLGEFWPAWVAFGLGCWIGFHYLVERSRLVTTSGGRAYSLHEGLTVYVVVITLVVWALSGGGYFWPVWPVVSLGGLLFLHFLVRDQAPMYRERALTERVEELTESRRGALDVQAAELRRIERDLHDGAQARLVALSMQLGRAEQRLADDADETTRDLLRSAQDEARLAIAELRDLARGIAPPVLTDRGLAAAAEALGKRSPLEVEVVAQIDTRPAPVVESAAYFVIAESLTNIAKHSPGAAVRVQLVGDRERLRIVVADDGVGGADPSGSGLAGLRQRALALDGTLTVVSPKGQGTTVVAELPCGS